MTWDVARNIFDLSLDHFFHNTKLFRQFIKFFLGSSDSRKTYPGVRERFGTTLDHLGWIRSILEEKKFFDFLNIFWSIFKAILAWFCTFSHVGRSKNQFFFKTKSSMKNLSDRKLDMVPNFAPLSAFDLKMKIERQVRFSVALPNAFFTACEAANSKKCIWELKFRLFKKFTKFFLGGSDGRKTSTGVRGVLWNHSGPSRMD